MQKLVPSGAKGQGSYSGQLGAPPVSVMASSDHASTSNEGQEAFHGHLEGCTSGESDSMTWVEGPEGVTGGVKAIGLGRPSGAEQVGDEWEIMHKPDSIPPSPTSLLSPPGALPATKHRFSAMDSNETEASSSKLSTLPSHAMSTSSQASSSSTSKRGRMTGSIALTNINHNFSLFNATYQHAVDGNAAQQKA